VDLVLGMSMAPSTVQMVLVEGKNGDGTTVDQDGFQVAPANTADAVTLTAANQAMAAILGTRESAAQGGYRLAATGVTYTDPVEAGALRDALAAHRVENIMLVSAFLAAAALAQAYGTTTGYTHTGLLFIEPDSATLAVVDSADGSVTDIRRASLPDDDVDAVAELTAMAAGADGLNPNPQGLFVVGSDGVDVGIIKAELEAATPLTVSAPTEPGSALARGAALASAHAPLAVWSTSAWAYAQDPGTGAADPVVPLYGGAEGTGSQQRAYSAEPDDGDLYTAVGGAEFLPDETAAGRRPFLVALGVLMVFVFGVAALTLSLALDIRPNVHNRPSLGKSVVVPAKPVPPPAQPPAAPAVAPAAPAPVAPAPAAPALPAPPPAIPQLPAPRLPLPGPGPLAPGPPPGPPGLGPMPGIPHGPGPGLPGIPHGGGPGLPHLPGLGGFHL
jgi:hypothetical protein